jgi:hypothetical protein
MSEPKYRVGEIVLYENPNLGSCDLIDGKRDILLVTYKYHSGFFKNKRWFYNGTVLEMTDTNSPRIPKVPKPVSGVTRIPESKLSSIESILKESV